MAWSHSNASSVALGTKSVIPTWFAPYVPGMIVSEPDWPAGAYRPGTWAGCGPRQSTTSLSRWLSAAKAIDPQPSSPSLTSNRRRTSRLHVRPRRSSTV